MEHNIENEEIHVWRDDGTNGIPSSDGRESFSLAPRIRARFDVVEARSPVAVQPGIEETKRRLAVRNTVVIEQRDYTGHCLDIDGQLGA